jgi:hypothetical protein
MYKNNIKYEIIIHNTYGSYLGLIHTLFISLDPYITIYLGCSAVSAAAAPLTKLIPILSLSSLLT